VDNLLNNRVGHLPILGPIVNVLSALPCGKLVLEVLFGAIDTVCVAFGLTARRAGKFLGIDSKYLSSVKARTSRDKFLGCIVKEGAKEGELGGAAGIN
jgi:hypothetical protein